eukprot:TRINITY_DN5810_c0_g1_i4.p1 TRINITY_DN5810_c0_g1~~TRINITY_DN5810_c0_g1_i4.p1  ORF type:complete len:304 (+),score=-12.36 TRINITY_DN5810_c0_g1_i4:446-1357(+)
MAQNLEYFQTSNNQPMKYGYAQTTCKHQRFLTKKISYVKQQQELHKETLLISIPNQQSIKINKFQTQLNIYFQTKFFQNEKSSAKFGWKKKIQSNQQTISHQKNKVCQKTTITSQRNFTNFDTKPIMNQNYQQRTLNFIQSRISIFRLNCFKNERAEVNNLGGRRKYKVINRQSYHLFQRNKFIQKTIFFEKTTHLMIQIQYNNNIYGNCNRISHLLSNKIAISRLGKQKTHRIKEIKLPTNKKQQTNNSVQITETTFNLTFKQPFPLTSQHVSFKRRLKLTFFCKQTTNKDQLIKQKIAQTN